MRCAVNARLHVHPLLQQLMAGTKESKMTTISFIPNFLKVKKNYLKQFLYPFNLDVYEMKLLFFFFIIIRLAVKKSQNKNMHHLLQS